MWMPRKHLYKRWNNSQRSRPSSAADFFACFGVLNADASWASKYNHGRLAAYLMEHIYFEAQLCINLSNFKENLDELIDLSPHLRKRSDTRHCSDSLKTIQTFFSRNGVSLAGKLFPPLVGVFCTHLEPPKYHIPEKNKQKKTHMCMDFPEFKVCPSSGRDMSVKRWIKLERYSNTLSHLQVPRPIVRWIVLRFRCPLLFFM